LNFKNGPEINSSLKLGKNTTVAIDVIDVMEVWGGGGNRYDVGGLEKVVQQAGGEAH
jgi:hypothetical protein